MNALTRILASAALAAGLTFGATGTASAAEGWGIDHEKETRFDAKVVDVLCELTGDCPANCGNGKRQLGLLRDNGRLLLVTKNFDPFAGAVADLMPFCGKRITADGLLIENPKLPMFMLQFKRPAPDGKWSRANWFTRDWAKRHGLKKGAKKADKWFYNDAMIKDAVKKDGVFGIPGLKPKPE